MSDREKAREWETGGRMEIQGEKRKDEKMQKRK